MKTMKTKTLNSPHCHHAGPDGHRRQRLRCNRGDRIDNREARQADRINEGRRSGELTWLGGERLRAEQARIHQMERWAKRDGYISREEARRIEQAQDAGQPPHPPREARRPDHVVGPLTGSLPVRTMRSARRR